MPNLFSNLFDKKTVPTNPETFNIPHIGIVQLHPEYSWYESKEFNIAVLGGKACRFIISGYADDQNKENFHDAIANFLSIDQNVLKASGQYVLAYYQDICEWTDAVEPPFITDEKDIWDEVTFPTDIHIGRRHYGDKKIYLSLECECSWEIEHGMSIVFKEGKHVNMIGSNCGHYTHSDGYAKPEYENRVYIETAELFKTS